MKITIDHNTTRYVSEDVEAAYAAMLDLCLRSGHQLSTEEADKELKIRLYTVRTPSGLPEMAPWHYQSEDDCDYAIVVPEQVGGTPMEQLSHSLLAELGANEVKALMLILRRLDPRLVKCTGMMADTFVRKEVLVFAGEVSERFSIRLRPMDKQLRAASRRENGKFKAIRLRQLTDSRTKRFDYNLTYELRRRLRLAGTTAAAAEVACKRHQIEGPKQPASTKQEILEKMRELLELLGG